MKQTKLLLLLAAFLLYSIAEAQNQPTDEQITETMLKATHYMVEDVSTNGGYVWNYLPDFSRRWGEMEAYPTMIWLQHPAPLAWGTFF